MENIFDEIRRTAAETAEKVYKKLLLRRTAMDCLKNNSLSIEEISKCFEISIEEVTALNDFINSKKSTTSDENQSGDIIYKTICDTIYECSLDVARMMLKDFTIEEVAVCTELPVDRVVELKLEDIAVKNAKLMLEDQKMSLQEIAEYTGVSLNTMRELKLEYLALHNAKELMELEIYSKEEVINYAELIVEQTNVLLMQKHQQKDNKDNE